MTRYAGSLVWVVLLLSASSTRAHASKSESLPPFQMTADEEKNVNRVLDRWEHWNAQIKTFDCRFKRWNYEVAFGAPNQAKFIEIGTIKYASPDRGLFRLDSTEKDGKVSPIENARAEHWMCDGKSIWEYSPAKKQVIEHKLPPEFQGSRLLDGPLAFGFPVAPVAGMLSFFQTGTPSPVSPFPFGANAKTVKQQYYIRTITPADPQDKIWLEAFPRPQKPTACLCQKLVLIFTARDMSPHALRIVQPNGKDYTVYQFYDIVVNAPAPTHVVPGCFDVPAGWQKIVEATPAATRPAN